MSHTVAHPALPELPPGMPAQGQWTYEDYCRLPDDSNRYEVIRGVLYVSPPPRTTHQRSGGRLCFRLHSFVEAHGLGEALMSPVAVILPNLATPVVPDVLFVVRERLHIIREMYVDGAPDLVAEVLSPSNKNHDRRTKFQIYAEAGVREYWIVDPRARTIEVFRLDGYSFKLHGRFTAGEIATSLVVPGFEVAVDYVCAE